MGEEKQLVSSAELSLWMLVYEGGTALFAAASGEEAERLRRGEYVPPVEPPELEIPPQLIGAGGEWIGGPGMVYDGRRDRHPESGSEKGGP